MAGTAHTVWAIPVELAQALLGPVGTAAVIRARLGGARFNRLARIDVRAGRYVATINFQEPIGPERQTDLVLMLRFAPGQEP